MNITLYQRYQLVKIIAGVLLASLIVIVLVISARAPDPAEAGGRK